MPHRNAVGRARPLGGGLHAGGEGHPIMNAIGASTAAAMAIRRRGLAVGGRRMVGVSTPDARTTASSVTSTPIDRRPRRSPSSAASVGRLGGRGRGCGPQPGCRGPLNSSTEKSDTASP